MRRYRRGLIAAVGVVVVGQVVGSFGSGDDPNGRQQTEMDPFFDLGDLTMEEKVDIFQVAVEIQQLGDTIRWPERRINMELDSADDWDKEEFYEGDVDDDDFEVDGDDGIELDEEMTQDEFELSPASHSSEMEAHSRGLRTVPASTEDSRGLQKMTRAPRARPRKGKGGGGKKGGGNQGGGKGGNGKGRNGKGGKKGGGSGKKGNGKKGNSKKGKKGKKGPVNPVAPSIFAPSIFMPSGPVDPPVSPPVMPTQPTVIPSRRPNRPSPPSTPPNTDGTPSPVAPNPTGSPVVAPTVEPGSPSREPTPSPTPEPTPSPTPEPTPQPTAGPTPEPTPNPTPRPAAGPTPAPIPGDTPEPTPGPTAGPTPPPGGGPVPATSAPSKGDSDRTAFPTPTGPFTRCFVEDSPDIGCPEPNIGAVCDKYNPLSSFQTCFATCIDAFCCIHDSPAERSPSCSEEVNCVFYDPCYIIWWKLHDTIGPAPYLRLDQDDAFYDVNTDDFVQIFTDRPDFFDQFFGHHFLTDDLPLTDDTFIDENNW